MHQLGAWFGHERVVLRPSFSHTRFMPVGPEWQHANPPQRQTGSGRQQPSQSGQKADAVGRAPEVARTALIWCATLPQSEWKRPVLVVCVAAALHRRQKKAREKASMPCSPRANREIQRTQSRLLTGRQQIDNFFEGLQAPGCLGKRSTGKSPFEHAVYGFCTRCGPD